MRRRLKTSPTCTHWVVFLGLLGLLGSGHLFGQDVYTVFPQLAVGGGFSFDLYFPNQGYSSGNITVEFFGDDGEPLTVLIDSEEASSIVFELKAGETRRLHVETGGGHHAWLRRREVAFGCVRPGNGGHSSGGGRESAHIRGVGTTGAKH